MSAPSLNLFIVDDNPLLAGGLRNYLNERFGKDLLITVFYTGDSAIRKIDSHTDIVILDYFLDGRNGNEILLAIKAINPKTEVIMYSSNENTAVAILAFRNGATDYVLKGEKSLKKIASLVYHIISYPVRLVVREFGINKYIAMFLATFVAMGIGIYCLITFSS